VANRYHYAFLEPAGGGPRCFALKPAQHLLRAAGAGREVRRFVRQVPEDAPASKRPKTASYASLDDPFSSPIADAMRAQLSSGLHVKTVYNTIYPAETTDLTPIVQRRSRRSPT